MWILIGAGVASKFELEEYYTLDEAIKAYALWRMTKDVQAAQVDKIRKNIKK